MRNRYELTPDGKFAIIYIRCEGVERATLISIDDLPRAQEIPTSWYGERRNWTMYTRCCFGSPRQYHYLHRWLLRPDSGNEIDHGDHDGLNNTRDNLAEVTPSENYENRRKEKDFGATDYRWYESKCAGYHTLEDYSSIVDDLSFFSALLCKDG